MPYPVRWKSDRTHRRLSRRQRIILYIALPYETSLILLPWNSHCVRYRNSRRQHTMLYTALLYERPGTPHPPIAPAADFHAATRLCRIYGAPLRGRPHPLTTELSPPPLLTTPTLSAHYVLFCAPQWHMSYPPTMELPSHPLPTFKAPTHYSLYHAPVWYNNHSLTISLTMELPSHPLPTFTPPTLLPLSEVDASGSKESHETLVAAKQIEVRSVLCCFALLVARCNAWNRVGPRVMRQCKGVNSMCCWPRLLGPSTSIPRLCCAFVGNVW